MAYGREESGLDLGRLLGRFLRALQLILAPFALGHVDDQRQRAGRPAILRGQRLELPVEIPDLDGPSRVGPCDGLLGERDCGIVEAILDELFAGLELGVADAVLFRQLRHESGVRDAVQARAGFLTRQRVARTDLRWQIDLPDRFEDYLASLSTATRKSIRRTAAQVEKAFGDRLAIRRFEDANELDDYLHLYLLNRDILLTPFHNMALMCPATTEADVDRHTEVFGAAVAELVDAGGYQRV